MTVPALFFVVPVTTPSVVEQVFEPSCGVPVVNLSNLPAPVAPQQVHPIVVVVVDAVVVVVVTVVVVVATGAVVVVVATGAVVVVVATGAVVVVVPTGAVVVVVATGAVVVVVATGAVVVVVATGAVVVVVATGAVVVVVPVGWHPPAPHASQQLGTLPTHALPFSGARQALGSLLILHVVTPLSSVWQQVTALLSPQVDCAAQSTTASWQAARRFPCLTALFATCATQLT